MKIMRLIKNSIGAVGLLLVCGQAYAGKPVYSVTITNLTSGQSFTPVYVASVRKGTGLYEFGAAASAELASLAEGGDSTPLNDALTAQGDLRDSTNGTGLVLPGQSETFEVTGGGRFSNLILGAMMLPTNDGFVALNGVKGPRRGRSNTYYLSALDAGSETNDELCASIPGPLCGGSAASPGDSGEGFVHIHDGIHGIGDLASEDHDWRNPVARVVVRRIY